MTNAPVMAPVMMNTYLTSMLNKCEISEFLVGLFEHEISHFIGLIALRYGANNTVYTEEGIWSQV